jgi:hypothetical protein
MKTYFFAVFLLLPFFWACQPGSTDAESRMLNEAFNALKAKSWDDFSELAITMSDYDLKQNNVSPFKAGQSFSGGVMKPQEMEKLRAQFASAVQGGEEFIDFSASEFISKGTVINRGVSKSLTGVDIPYTTYALKIRKAGAELDTKDLDPAFVVVKWGERYRLLRLDFMEASS